MEPVPALSILSIATEWHSGHGGITTFNRELCSALARLGNKVFCGVPTITEAEQEAAKAHNVHLVAPAPVPGMDGIEALARPFKHLGPVDIVIGHGRITGQAAVAQVTDTLRSARYVHFVHMDPKAIEWYKHDNDSVDATKTAEERCNLEIALGMRADLIVAVGPELHGAYAMYLQPHSRRPHLFLPGLFASDWTPSPYGLASCLLFGRAEDAELKGLTIAAQAMADVCRAPGPLSHARLVVRGSPASQGDQLQKKLTEASEGMTNVVVQEYTADAAKIREDIRSASLVLMPSRQEGFGLSGLEAISEGIPVLLSHTSGLAQAIETYVPDGARIHIVDLRGGRTALAERIVERLSDRESAFAYARELREAMRPHFNWDTATRDLLNAITSAPSPPTGGGHRPSAPIAHSSTRALADTLASVSSGLFAWRQTLRTTDQWVERPELAKILEHVRDKASRPLVLLGPPGSGKSALMARCATQLRADGVAVLGIKADALPNTVDSLSALAAELNLPRNITTAIAAVAELQPTVLFIDQLDALADLVDLRTERLSILLVLAVSLAEAGVRVVLSCRDFDFAHDVRFEQLDAEELRLEPPSDEAMKEVFAANNLNPTILPRRLRELIKSPQLLDALLELRERAEASPANTQQQVLAQLWESRLRTAADPVATSSAAEQIAFLMGEREELWLPREVIAEKQLVGCLPTLLHSGVLIEKDGKVAFVHQTMFELARARAFMSTGESLSEHVHKRQDALFVRPTLWTTLEYLRSSDPAIYVREIEALWLSQKTRTHVRRLLWDFLGQRADPNDYEVALVTDGLGTDASRRTAITAVTGNAGWFRELHGSLLPSLLRGTDAHMLVGLLAAAMQFARTEATELVETYWRDDSSKARLIATVLALAKDWSGRMEALAVHVISRGLVDEELVNSLIYHAVHQRPDAAPRLIAAHLECKRAALGPIPDTELGEDARAQSFAKYDRLAPLRELLERSAGLHSMIEAAKAAPASFLASVWPWFVGVVRELAEDSTQELSRYRDDGCLGTSVRHGRIVQELAAAIDVAIRQVGSTDAAAMIRFVGTWQAEDTLAVHRFLMAGMRAALPASAPFATTYLRADERRLAVGDWNDDDLDTVEFLTELAPHIDLFEIRSVEDMVLRSRCVSEDQEKVEWRRSARDINRRHRLRLLRALGVDRLSISSRALVEQEERRFPGPDEPRMAVTFTSRGAPVTSEQMLVAKDNDILNLFRELPDSTDWDHPSDPMRGGSIQAARELAEAAKRDPERFAALLHSFEPGVSERPVALVFGALAEVIPLSRLEDKLHALVAAGFFRGSYRHDAAWALRRAVRDGATMRPETCALLTSWLADSSEPDEPERPEPDRDDSLLFGMRGGGMLPGGNYPVLLALTSAYLVRSEPAVDAWLTMLERHLDRNERSAVWEALSPHLEYVLLGSTERADALLTRLFRQFPRVRDSLDGLAIVARAIHCLPEATIARWIADIEGGQWTRRKQAVGELLGLLSTRLTPPSWAEARVSAELTAFAGGGGSPELVLGLTYATAHVWGVPERRSSANQILLRIVPDAIGPIASAVMGVFRAIKGLQWDAATQRLLVALRDHPQVLAADRGPWLIDRLRELLPSGADLIADVTLALVSELGKSGRRGHLLSHGPELADVSLTLQRLGPATRSKGLDLFELLLEQDAYGIHDVLAELDPARIEALAGRPARRVRSARRRPVA